MVSTPSTAYRAAKVVLVGRADRTHRLQQRPERRSASLRAPIPSQQGTYTCQPRHSAQPSQPSRPARDLRRPARGQPRSTAHRDNPRPSSNARRPERGRTRVERAGGEPERGLQGADETHRGGGVGSRKRVGEARAEERGGRRPITASAMAATDADSMRSWSGLKFVRNRIAGPARLFRGAGTHVDLSRDFEPPRRCQHRRGRHTIVGRSPASSPWRIETCSDFY